MVPLEKGIEVLAQENFLIEAVLMNFVAIFRVKISLFYKH